MPKVYIPGETKAQRKSRKKAEKARRNQEIKVASRIAPTVPKPKPPEKAPNENHQIKKTDTVFVLGNGTSRKPIALEPLKSHGTIYGCNALFREFTPAATSKILSLVVLLGAISITRIKQLFEIYDENIYLTSKQHHIFTNWSYQLKNIVTNRLNRGRFKKKVKFNEFSGN